MDPRLVSARAPHDPGCRLLLLGPGATQVRPFPHHALDAVGRRGGFPVVLLGLQPGLLAHRQRLHRRPVQLRPHEDARPALGRQLQDSGPHVLPLPGHVRSHYVSSAPLLLQFNYDSHEGIFVGGKKY